MKVSDCPGGSVSLVIILFCFLIPFIAIGGRDKTDKVILMNGDEITCEIKKLEFGLLTAKTDDAGTLEIKWHKVARVFSTYIFEIEMQDGTIYFGKFGAVNTDQRVSIVTGPTVKEVDLIKIVNIVQIENRFWTRLDGSISAGLNLTQANNLVQWNSNLSTTYRARTHFTTISYSGNNTIQSEKLPSQRQDGNLIFNKNLKNKWFALGYMGATSNSELALKLRLSIGGGPGKQLVQSNRNMLGVIAGVVANREWSLEDDQKKENSLEGLLSLRFSRFKYDSPKSKITTSVSFLPGLIPWGRYRSELNLEVSQEIVSDFTIGINGYLSYDSNPIAIGAKQTDYSINLTIGYAW
jgi:hypothetical protein